MVRGSHIRYWRACTDVLYIRDRDLVPQHQDLGVLVPVARWEEPQ
jgi:hypothetical protein